TLSQFRTQIITAIPEGIKHAVAAGIGLFIAYIALTGAKIIIPSEATTTILGNLNDPTVLITLAGILITSALIARRITGALLFGILATAALGWILGITPWPTAIVGLPQLPVDLFGQGIIGLTEVLQVNFFQIFTITFVFFFVDLFDTVGTLTGL
ncbi:MAG: solute carrier family 23 protein, partial [Planktothrix sp.]|uniref:solute carrier family 23 protein n=1 Tax=Planktothrix sp. TaxID=3088171 RepID=UPI0038D37977